MSHQPPDDWWAYGRMIKGIECSLGYLLFFITLEEDTFFFYERMLSTCYLCIPNNTEKKNFWVQGGIQSLPGWLVREKGT